jgi:predicted phosphate transport protein (TIGR00153 family)
MNNSFFSKFTPKEPKFFPILKEMADVILVASDLIIECVQDNDHEKSIEYYKKIKEQEKRGDALSARVFNELNSTFITPFDREDIHHLADKLDDVTDYINSSAKRIVLYNPKQLPASALEIAKLIKEGAISIGKAVDQLDVLKKNSKKIKEYCQELKITENKADDVYENFLIDLFENQKDGIEIIKLKEIMSELEKATDAAEIVGKIIKTIIVKYA